MWLFERLFRWGSTRVELRCIQAANPNSQIQDVSRCANLTVFVIVEAYGQYGSDFLSFAPF